MNLGFLAILAALAVGIPVGYFVSKSINKDDGYYASLLTDFDKSYTQMIANEINTDNMRAHLKYLTSIPHMGGTSGDKVSADYVYKSWMDQKLDHVGMIDYDVYLSFPDDEKFNNIQITSPNGTELFDIIEPTFDSNLDYTGIPKPFLAYAKAGSVNSNEVYYANYCAEEDFLELISQGINVSGKIVICRYGLIFRGNKVDFAEKFGAKGVLIFEEPKRFAPAELKDEVYPNGQYLPGEGVQRGTIYNLAGDPMTPNYPSTPSAYRLNPNGSKSLKLPNVPAQVIGYKLAENIFRLMQNNKRASVDWTGEMNVTYTYGGKLSGNKTLTLNVFNQRRIAKTYNVQATITGSTEPDKYVIIGNHRDSWSFGAIDPNSGTATMLEVSRVLMEMKLKKGWVPKRSIIFMSWGSEEYGLMGSQEWVEEFKKKLKANAVAYLNIDTVAEGKVRGDIQFKDKIDHRIDFEGNFSYRASGTPSLHKLLIDVTKSIKISDSESVYDRWAKNEPSSEPDKKGQPDISPFLGSGSDYTGFTQLIGIPAIEQGFVRDSHDSKHNSFGLKTHPTYHSSYETYRLVSEYIDPEFFSFKIVATVAAELLRVISDSLILPIDVVASSKEIQKQFKSFESQYKATMDNLGISLAQFRESVDNLPSVASNFQERLDKMDKSKYHLIRTYNEQLRRFEEAFIDPFGINRDGYEHMVNAPSVSDAYGSDSFPALTDAIYDYNKQKTEENKNKIKQSLSIIIYTINSAISILKEPFDFSRTAI